MGGASEVTEAGGTSGRRRYRREVGRLSACVSQVWEAAAAEGEDIPLDVQTAMLTIHRWAQNPGDDQRPDDQR